MAIWILGVYGACGLVLIFNYAAGQVTAGQIAPTTGGAR